jgi:DAK2 domain fusion protein YloV
MANNKDKDINKKANNAKTKNKKTAKEGTPKKKTSSFKYLGGLLLKKMAFGGAKELSSNADEVNKLNVFPVPDGDTGDNMRMTIESGISAMENNNSDDLAEAMKSLSQGMLLGARGNSGVILSQFFAGMSKGLENSEKADAQTLGKALEDAVQQAYSSVMTPTEGTILTVAREAVEYAVSRITPKSTIRSLFSDLVKEMHRSVKRTPEILPVLKDAGVVDSGAAGLFYIMDGFNSVLNGNDDVDDIEFATASEEKKAPLKFGSFGPDSVMTYGYCTEFLLQLQNSKIDINSFDVESLKAFLAEIGDSIVAFKNDSIVKVHVHTLTPERVLAYARQYGEFLTVKIENMSIQHSELQNDKEEPEAAKQPEANEPKKKYGVVAVCNGSGVESLFVELGADVTVSGGQTHNPSTNDFIEAFEKINAEHIFVLPNNSNIFMAAQQAGDIYGKATIHVIPSKSIGTGYVALSSINFDNYDEDSVIEEVEEAMRRVTAGYISPSIRDADMNGIHINNGDTIGIIDKEIVISEQTRSEAAHKLAAMLLELPEKFMLTVFCGVDSSAEERSELEEYLKSAHPDAEIYFINGEQEVYPYIFVAE